MSYCRCIGRVCLDTLYLLGRLCLDTLYLFGRLCLDTPYLFGRLCLDTLYLFGRLCLDTFYLFGRLCLLPGSEFSYMAPPFVTRWWGTALPFFPSQGQTSNTCITMHHLSLNAMEWILDRYGMIAWHMPLWQAWLTETILVPSYCQMPFNTF